MKKYRAISLIEVLVVVAVIGILAAAAAPNYNASLARTRIDNALSYMKSLKIPIMDYYTQNAVFPTEEQLGIPADNPTPPDMFLPPYIVYIDGVGEDTAGECPNATYLAVLTDYDHGSYYDGEGYALQYVEFYVDVKGTIQHFCYYYEVDSATFSPTGRVDLIPNCTGVTVMSVPSEITDAIQTGCD